MTARFGAIPAPTDRFVAGIGFASAASAGEIIALIRACLAELNLHPSQLAAIGTHMRKATSPLLLPVALYFAVPMRLLDDADLSGDVPGVADAVAAMAGPVRLHKRKSDYATCAISDCAPGFSVASFGQPVSANASIAPSTLLTSSAGP
ncbi:cobalamin biosynthesis protein [Devosia sp. J2-20]|uniref:cobalamin biosynthesis protein n=1 Tax=Devosia sp. J2-20 TaxID=3026161 RepID=UPI00249A7CA4|nr:cobalamin biosynthesis protein [Devosia sp. J2-20]WDQ97545.1 cobalamin biosynthesis protein [Devosia sp. J2-20]